MGHGVDYLGAFAVTPPLSDELQAWIDGPLIEDPWEALEQAGLETDLTTNETWWTAGDPARLEWTGAEKSYDGAAWLQWLLDTVLVPAGHTVSGTVHRFAEPDRGFVEASRIEARGTAVTEVHYDTDDEPPWHPDGPSLDDAFFLLSEGDAHQAQQELLAYLKVTPLAAHGGVVAFLEDVAEHWPDPEAVRDALAIAAGRASAAAAPTPAAQTDETARRSWWDRLLGR